MKAVASMSGCQKKMAADGTSRIKCPKIINTPGIQTSPLSISRSEMIFGFSKKDGMLGDVCTRVLAQKKRYTVALAVRFGEALSTNRREKIPFTLHNFCLNIDRHT